MVSCPSNQWKIVLCLRKELRFHETNFIEGQFHIVYIQKNILKELKRRIGPKCYDKW